MSKLIIPHFGRIGLLSEGSLQINGRIVRNSLLLSHSVDEVNHLKNVDISFVHSQILHFTNSLKASKWHDKIEFATSSTLACLETTSSYS